MLHQPVNVIRRVRWIGNKDIKEGRKGGEEKKNMKEDKGSKESKKEGR